MTRSRQEPLGAAHLTAPGDAPGAPAQVSGARIRRGAIPWVLHYVTGSRWTDPRDRRKDFSTALRTAIDSADLPDRLRPHDLRRRRCTKWLAEGHSPALVRKAMRHSSLDVTLQYEHLVRGGLEGMVEEEERRELAAMKGGNRPLFYHRVCSALCPARGG